MNSSPLRIAVAGLGTVGAETVRLIETQAPLLEQRTGCAVSITAVAARDRSRDRGIDLTRYRWFDDAEALAAADDIDIVVELIGGADGIAKSVVETALFNGRHVVTANKALIAHHGTALALQAEEADRALCFEASVAGGIPIIKSLREGLAANSVAEVHGILNGTCNYILSEMRDTGRDFADVLAEAQSLGYAEADPSFDIDGVDAAHKLAILTALAFGVPVAVDSVYSEGIRNISIEDIRYADELGYRIKLLAIARRRVDGIEQRVHPCMIPTDQPTASIEGVFNGVAVIGDYVDRVMSIGRGAGAGPTASAVVADIVDIARGCRTPPFGVPVDSLAATRQIAMEERRGAYYIRLHVIDKPGVVADIAAAMRDEGASIGALLQRGRAPDSVVPVVLTTHETTEAAIQRIVARLIALETVTEPPCVIRIEAF